MNQTLLLVFLSLVFAIDGESTKSKYSDRRKAPFTAKHCNDPEVPSSVAGLLETLANEDITKNHYGYQIEELISHFNVDENGYQDYSGNNELEILKSDKNMNTEDFMKSQKKTLQNKINAVLETFKGPSHFIGSGMTKEMREIYNVESYKSYFVFAVTTELKPVLKKLKNTDWKAKININENEFNLLRNHLLYIGSGQAKRPFDHVISTGKVLVFYGKNRIQPLHFFLAKSLLKDQKTKILVVPFHSCNNYAACAYNEFATIYTHTNLTMNARPGDLYQFGHKLCVDQEDPRKYVRNILSKETLQFVSDINVDSGIRQIGKFGVILSLSSPLFERNKNNGKQYMNSAFQWLKAKTRLNVFNNKIFTELFENKFVIFPFEKVDFKFEEKIDKLNLANTIEFFLKTKLSSIPALKEKIIKEISSYLEKLRNPEDPTVFGLHDLLRHIYSLINNIVLQITNPQRKIIAQLKINMFEAAFENHLFNRLIIGNSKVQYISENPLSSPSSRLILEVPEKFINIKSKRENSHYEPTSTCDSQYKCSSCDKTFDDISNLKNHEESSEGRFLHYCPVCHSVFSNKRYFRIHQHKTFIHHLTSIAQGTPTFLATLKDPVAAPFKCPFEKKHDMSFRYEKECRNHIQSHRSNTNFQPKLRLKNDEREKGVFKCKYCNFKTDSEKYANYHLKEAHMSYLIMADQMKELEDNPDWMDIRNNHFSVDYKNSLKKAGEYFCTIGNNKMGISKKSKALSHLAAKKNINEFKKISSDSKKPENEREAAKKIIKLWDDFDCSKKTNPKLKHPNNLPASELSFLDLFIRHKKTTTCWWSDDGNLLPNSNIRFSNTREATVYILPQILGILKSDPKLELLRRTFFEKFKQQLTDVSVLNDAQKDFLADQEDLFEYLDVKFTLNHIY